MSKLLSTRYTRGEEEKMKFESSKSEEKVFATNFVQYAIEQRIKMKRKSGAERQKKKHYRKSTASRLFSIHPDINVMMKLLPFHYYTIC